MKWILTAFSVGLALAQGTEPKPKAAEYDVSGRSDQIEIGAEFMVHSFSGEGQMFIAEDFLIVEVSLYPPKDGTVTVNNGAFSLRVNGKKPSLTPLGPQMFAASLRRSNIPIGGSYPDVATQGPWPAPGTSSPGGPMPRTTPLPRRPPVPGSPRSTDTPEARAEDVAVRSALPEGETKGPVSGFLYFAYRGKISGIKSLELLYDRTTLKLR